MVEDFLLLYLEQKCRDGQPALCARPALLYAYLGQIRPT